MPYSIWNSKRSGAMSCSRAKAIAWSTIRSSWVAMAWQPAVGQQPLRQPQVGRVDVRLVGEGDRGWLLVGALAQADPRALGDERLDIGLAAPQGRLDDDADVALAGHDRPELAPHVEGRVRGRCGPPCRSARRPRAPRPRPAPGRRSGGRPAGPSPSPIWLSFRLTLRSMSLSASARRVST